EWFGGNLLLAEASSRSHRQAYTKQMLDDEMQSKHVENLLRAADIGVTGAQKVPIDPVVRERLERALRILTGKEAEPDGVDGPAVEQLGINLIHEANGEKVAVEQNDESLGTLVWFGLIGPVVDSLARGSVFLADELDASLHPILANQLVRLFQSPKTNPHHAQLIFNTHNVALIGDPDNRLLGRDQIWFTVKPSDASSRLYPLSDMDPRKDEAIGLRYLLGRYGAIPILSNSEFDSVAELVTNPAS
ncbi:MAG: AAA family ATPase, partial [Ilumatobacteraceae bacterium]